MVYTVRALSSILQSEMDVVIAQLDLLFLSMETGTSPVVTDGNVILNTPLRADSLAVDEDIDESSFEIIREKK